MLIIPAIDLKDARCVRLTQGRASDVTTYDADPVAVAREFEAAGARLLHVVDLDAAFGAASANTQVIERIVAELSIPVEVGGGMRSIDAVRSMLARGVRYAIVGTLAVKSPDVLEKLVAEFDDQVVVGIDARDGQVMTHGWEAGSGVAATELARRVAGVGVRRIIYTDVSRDGMLGGINLEQTARVAAEVAPAGATVTASGGVGSLADIERLVAHTREQGNDELMRGTIESVIVGKALYENRFTLADALRAADVR